MNIPMRCPMALAAILLSSCATQVPVQIMKPAEINMAGARRIAILDFDYPREARTGGPFGLLDLYLSGKGDYGSSTVERRVAKFATDQLIQAMVATDYFTVVNSTELASKMWVSDSGRLSAAEIGRRSDVQAIIVGEILSVDRNSRGEYETEKVEDAKTGTLVDAPVRYTSATDSVSMSYRVVDTKDGAYERALALYEAIWERAGNPAAGTNAAIMLDVLGRLDEALAKIAEVVDRSADGDAVREQARMKRLRAEEDRLAEQMK